MNRCRFTRDAEQDLIDIYITGLEAYGLKRAEAYQDLLAKKFQTLADNPSFGSDYGGLRPHLRRAESIAHSVYYQETPGGILVLRILYKRMDPVRHLQG